MYHIADLDAAPLDWEIDEVRKMPPSPHWPLEAQRSELLWGPASSNARTCFGCAMILRQNLRFFAEAWALAASTTCSGCMATR